MISLFFHYFRRDWVVLVVSYLWLWCCVDCERSGCDLSCIRLVSLKERQNYFALMGVNLRFVQAQNFELWTCLLNAG
jgi:hypothetical protein